MPCLTASTGSSRGTPQSARTKGPYGTPGAAIEGASASPAPPPIGWGGLATPAPTSACRRSRAPPGPLCEPPVRLPPPRPTASRGGGAALSSRSPLSAARPQRPRAGPSIWGGGRRNDRVPRSRESDEAEAPPRPVCRWWPLRPPPRNEPPAGMLQASLSPSFVVCKLLMRVPTPQPHTGLPGRDVLSHGYGTPTALTGSQHPKWRRRPPPRRRGFRCPQNPKPPTCRRTCPTES